MGQNGNSWSCKRHMLAQTLSRFNRVRLCNPTVCLCPVESDSCDPMDCSPPGSSVHRVLQAGMLEWVPVPFTRRSSQPRDQNCFSRVSCIA